MDGLAKVWHGLITCSHCGAICGTTSNCPVCDYDFRLDKSVPMKVKHGDRYIEVPMTASVGAIPWTTYCLLRMIEREYQRPNTISLFGELNKENQPSEKLAIVVLFWSLFENLMDKFFSDGLNHLPVQIKNDLLKRYSSVGSRFDRLYPIVFATNFKDDLTKVGGETVYEFVIEIQRIRNEFIHGNPEAVKDAIVQKTMDNLHSVQRAWIDLYNLRCTKRSNSGRL
jgi:hypothetical protein